MFGPELLVQRRLWQKKIQPLYGENGHGRPYGLLENVYKSSNVYLIYILTRIAKCRA